MQINITHCLMATALVLGASLLGLVSCTERSPMDYLLKVSGSRHRAQLDWVRRQVELKGGNSVQETRSFLERAERMADLLVYGKELTPDQLMNDDTGVVSYEPRSAVTTLWALLDGFKGMAHQDGLRFGSPCGSYGVVNFLTIFGDIFGHDTAKFLLQDNEKPEHDVKLFNFMKHYARDNYRKCLKLMELNSFKITYQGGDAGVMETQQLDEIFSLGQNDNMSQDQLLELARELDLVGGKFDAKKMYTLTDNLDSKPHSHGTKAKRTFVYIDSICQRYRSKLANNFDAYNMARALLAPDEFKLKPDAKFLKMNEYSRLCIQFQDSKLREDLRENMEENMKCTWYKKVLFGNNA